MTRKFYSAIFAAGLALALLAAPAAVSAFTPADPGVTTSTERIHADAAAPDVAIVQESQTRERLRPSVVVYNMRTCETKTPDGSGRLITTNIPGHRTFAVPWLRCRSA